MKEISRAPLQKKILNNHIFELKKNFDLGTPCIGNAETKRPLYKSQRHKSCMMNRQIRVEKIIGTVKCVATCGAIEIQAVET